MADDNNSIVANLKSGVTYLGKIALSLTRAFPQITGSAGHATAGTSGSLPATPAGYITIILPDGSTGVIPYYHP